jgi:hypothetical protein
MLRAVIGRSAVQVRSSAPIFNHLQAGSGIAGNNWGNKLAEFLDKAQKGEEEMISPSPIRAVGSLLLNSRLRLLSLGIPVKVNIDSGGKPNGVPERR